MRETTKPNEQRKRLDADFTWEQFAKDCVLNKYALVVGPEAILNRDVNPEAEGNSKKLLFDLTLRTKAATEARVGDEEEEYQYLKRRYRNFTELVRKCNYHDIRKCVLETIKETSKEHETGMETEIGFDKEIEPSLMDLLYTRCFRIVLSTAIDPYLEMAMKEVWGEGGFDVIQIENAQQIYKQVTYDEFEVTKPVLCYVFGKVNPERTLSENKFVLSENDAIEKISSWFENQKNNSFLRYVRNYRLLSVGCQFDDWMFRFFWFLLRGRVSTEDDGQVAVEIKNDDTLKQYLKDENVKVFANARSFMQDAVSYIKIATDINLLPRQENGVFISYAHEDRYIALPLFERLHEAGINVWLDEEKLESGAEYEQRIQKAINSCKVFMPILSSQVKSDLTSKDLGDRWYQKEWAWAQQRYDAETNIASDSQPRFKTIPVVVGDYRFSEPYHQALPHCLTAASAFETAKDDIENLIRMINV